MVLNKYVWNNYLKAGGADVVEMFHQNLTGKYTKSYAVEIRRMVSKYCPMEKTLDEIQDRLIQLYDYVNSDDFPTQVAVFEDMQRERDLAQIAHLNVMRF